jgi:hypothetical protein
MRYHFPTSFFKFPPTQRQAFKYDIRLLPINGWSHLRTTTPLPWPPLGSCCYSAAQIHQFHVNVYQHAHSIPISIVPRAQQLCRWAIGVSSEKMSHRQQFHGCPAWSCFCHVSVSPCPCIRGRSCLSRQCLMKRFLDLTVSPSHCLDLRIVSNMHA